MIIILDWIFESAITWVASIVTAVMDGVSGIFINALGTDMTAMEEYFPFVASAFDIMQYTAWMILFLITIWQLFRTFSGPMSEAENPLHLLVRSAIFTILIGYAKPIFEIILEIARAPYTALWEYTMMPADFTFAGIENVLKAGVTTIVGAISVVGLLLVVIMMIGLGWNYFKLLLEVVERYVLVGVLCYTSPLAFSLGGSKATNKVFQSWCRMVGSQMLLLVMNVWFLRAFSSSVGQFVGNGGALSNGKGDIYLWLFCALALLKVAQKLDNYLSALGLSVAQTGSGMGFEMMMAARAIGGFGGGGGSKSVGSIFRGAPGAGASGVGGIGGVAAGFASKFKGNSYVRDAVVDGGTKLGAGGGLGFVARAFGGIAARNGATLTGNSISSVASRLPNNSGTIAGDIANKSLSNYMPHLAGKNLNDTQITGGQIRTTATGADGKASDVQMFNASQYEKPNSPHSVVNSSDGSQWYQMASGEGMGEFYSAPQFTGDASEAELVSSSFPGTPEGTTLRSVDEGTIEACNPETGNSMWYNSAFYQEPDAPHETISSSDGVSWYAMQPHADVPQFDDGTTTTSAGGAFGGNIPVGTDGTPIVGTSTEGGTIEGMPMDNVPIGADGTVAGAMNQGGTSLPIGDASGSAPEVTGNSAGPNTFYNQAQFQQFMPGYGQTVSSVDSSRRDEGMLEVKHNDGSGTRFYDKSMYQSPRGDYQVLEDNKGGQWYAVGGNPSVERRPVYENGKAVYDDKGLKTTNVETIKYKTTPTKFDGPKKRDKTDRIMPKRK